MMKAFVTFLDDDPPMIPVARARLAPQHPVLAANQPSTALVAETTATTLANAGLA